MEGLSKKEKEPMDMDNSVVIVEGRLGGGGIKQKGKRTHGHGQQCGDCGEGDERDVRGLLNRNGKIQ